MVLRRSHAIRTQSKRLFIASVILIAVNGTGALTGTGDVFATDGGGSIVAGVDGTQIMAGVRFDSPASSSSCEWSPVDTRDPQIDGFEEVRRDANGISYRLYDRGCPNDTGDYHWVPEVDPGTLAQQASSVVYDNIPAPWGEFAPPARRGVVNLGTWFWVNPMLWVPVRASAWVPTPSGPLIVTTTATPKKLIFDPGDGALGSGETECTGPGIPWIPAFGDHLPSPCMYTYRHSSARRSDNVFAATLSIRWHVTYSSNTGASGSLGDVTVGASHQMVVREIHGLVNR